MSDLKRMVPRGSDLHRFIVAKDYQVTTFEQWLQLIDQYKSMLPKRSEERRPEITRRGGDVFESDEGEDFGDEDERAARIGDARQASRARPPLRARGGPGASRESLEAVPRCSTCG